MKNLRSSLRIRIAGVVLLCGIIPCLIFQLAMLRNYEKQIIEIRMYDAQQQCNVLARQMLAKNYIQSGQDENIESDIRELAKLINGRILVIDRSLLVISDSAEQAEGNTVMSESALHCVRGEGSSGFDEKGAFLEVTVPVTDGNFIMGGILVRIPAASLEETMNAYHQQAWIWLAGLAGAVVLLAVLLAQLLVRPIIRVGNVIENTVESYDNEMQTIPTYTEMESIISAVNTTMGRMRLLDKTRQEFVSNVSHELKTPITSIKVLAESLIGQDNIPVEIYQEFMGDIAQEIDRESQIIEELLSLVRLDKEAALMIKSTYINDLLELLIKRLQPIAAERKIEIVLESFRPIMAEIDENKLGLAFSNLIENAIKYNKDEGWVHVSLNSDLHYFYVTVEDSGKGIEEADKEHVFERFYRGDKSHSSKISGTGLGLSITRNAVMLHHGTIKLESEVGKGSTFIVKIPLHYQK